MHLSPWRGLLVAIIALLIPLAIVLASLEYGSAEAELRFSQGPEVPTLDPQKMQDVSGGRLAGALFEGLLVFDPATSQPRPGVAERWEISPDGLVYTFGLRKTARWSDGSPVTASDFLYSWCRALDVRTASPYNYMLHPIKGSKQYAKATEGLEGKTARQIAERLSEARKGLGILVVSPTELRVTLKQPTRSFLDLVTFQTYLPVKRECVERMVDGRPAEDPAWTHPGKIISNGPYLLEVWKLKWKMRLVRNPFYWNRDKVKIGVIEVYPIEDANTAYIQYEQGLLDFITTVPPLAAEKLFKQQKQGRRDDFYCDEQFGTYYYRFNCTKRPFDDLRVRKALALALDKQELVDKVGRLNQRVAKAFVPPHIGWYKGPRGLDRDPELARRLLAEAGYPGGEGFPEVSLLYNTSESHKNMAELAQEQWKRELGINVKLTNLEWKVYLQKVTNLDYQIARAGWIGDYLDPNTFLDMFVTDGGNNNTGWSNAEYDRLIKEAAGQGDTARQAEIFRRAETILVEQELPILPVYVYKTSSLIRPWVKGFHPNPINRIMFNDLWIERPGDRR
ncbi:MAG: peptide ABC transporter substrate-binding protein [Anaerolineaceae bacterium]|nr:peptide ABC transporter substrate-binding protein [Anaerolineaceae bacterium]